MRVRDRHVDHVVAADLAIRDDLESGGTAVGVQRSRVTGEVGDRVGHGRFSLVGCLTLSLNPAIC